MAFEPEPEPELEVVVSVVPHRPSPVAAPQQPRQAWGAAQTKLRQRRPAEPKRRGMSLGQQLLAGAALLGMAAEKPPQKNPKELWALVRRDVVAYMVFMKRNPGAMGGGSTGGDIWTAAAQGKINAELERALAAIEAGPQEETRHAGCCPVLLPATRFRVFWDFFQIAALLWVAATIPLFAAFDISFGPDSAVFWWDVALDLYFIADIFVNFRAAIFDDHGRLVVSSAVIARHYLRGWFCLDFVSCLPVEYVVLLMNIGKTAVEGDDGSDLKTLKILRLFRLGKLLRLGRLAKLLERYEEYLEQVAGALKAFVAPLAFIIMLSHMVGSVYYIVAGAEGWAKCWVHEDPILGAPEPEPEPEPEPSVLIDSLYRQGLKVHALHQNEALTWTDELTNVTTTCNAGVANDQGGAGTLRLYLIALHAVSPKLFSILDFHDSPFTSAELMATIVFELFSLILFGWLSSSLNSQISKTSKAKIMQTENMHRLRLFLDERKIPMTVRRKVRLFYEHYYKLKSFDESAILKHLPPSMASELVYCLYKETVQNCPLFRGLGDEIVQKLCVHMKPYAVQTSHTIVKEGTIGQDLYLILVGKVMVQEAGVAICVLQAGAFFGEVSLLAAANGHSCPVRSKSCISVTNCELCFLDRQAGQTMLKEFPELRKRLQHFSLSRQQRDTVRAATNKTLVPVRCFVILSLPWCFCSCRCRFGFSSLSARCTDIGIIFSLRSGNLSCKNCSPLKMARIAWRGQLGAKQWPPPTGRIKPKQARA